jgi:hypothetical protein
LAVEAREPSMKSLIIRLTIAVAVLFCAAFAAADDWTDCLMSDYAAEVCVHSPAAVPTGAVEVAEVDTTVLESGEIEFPGDAPAFATTGHTPDGANFDDLPDASAVHVALLIPAER